MSIKLNVSEQDKLQTAGLAAQVAILDTLLQERKIFLEKKAQEILTANGLSANLYSLKFNPAEDKWEAVLKQGTLVVPDMSKESLNKFIKGG